MWIANEDEAGENDKEKFGMECRINATRIPHELMISLTLTGNHVGLFILGMPQASCSVIVLTSTSAKYKNGQ